MAGTGLPTGGNRPPVLLDPSPLVQPDASGAQAWGALKQTADAATRDFGQIAQQAEHASQLKWAADFELDARDKRIELHALHPEDPSGFEKDWQAYTDGKLGSVPLKYADHARVTLRKEGQSAFASIQGAKITKDRALTANSVNARLDAAQTDVLGYAYRGEAGGEPFTQAMLDYRAYLNDGVKAGLWSQELADNKVNELAGKAKAESIVGMSKRLFDQKGLEGGYAEAERLLSDPSMKLDPREVEQYRGRISAEMNKWAGFQSADLQKVQAQAAAIEDKFKLGTATEDEARGLAASLASLGDRRGASKVLRGFTTQEQLATDAWQPPTATAANIAAQRQRVRPYEEKVAGAENATGNPAARNPNSTATGDGQFIDSTWLDIVKRTAPEVAAGKSDAEILALRSDPKLSRQMIRAYGEENRAELAAAGLPTDDGSTYLAHFAGLGGAKAVLRADPAMPIRDLLLPGAMAANAGMRLNGKPFADWTAADLRTWAAGKMGDSIDTDTLQARIAANQKKEEALRADPLSYISSIRGGPRLADVDWTKPDAAATALADRQQVARAASSIYGIGPAPVLTKPELDQLKAAWDQGDSGTRARIVGTLARSLDGKHLTATLEKVAGDNPVFASAGMIYQQSPDLALSIVRGISYVDADKKILPPEKNVRTEVNDFLGTAASSMPQARSAIEKTALARYADLSAAAKDFTGAYNGSRMQQALRDVTGGVVSWGQGTKLFGLAGVPKIIPPKPGMTDSDFGKLIDSLTDADLTGMTTGSGTQIRASEFRRLASLHDAGPGRYMVEIGGGFARGADGQPFVLDLGAKVTQ
ncbi:hypothetical protein [Azospirillum himalayense]|uniref:Uncharacterized protein n=1 Tax=Azospirillum himalayense TaxID=654847 RepID=A0ABW0G460_9PROT